MLRLRRAWLAAVIPLIVVAVVTCSDDAPPPASKPDSGAQPGQLTESVCPDAAPEAGEGCAVPEGTTCSFGACAAIAQCTRGRWKFAGNPLPAPSCPVDFPSSDQPCPVCFPENGSCLYGTCEQGDATANVSRATCNTGRWSIEVVRVCPIADAGADVQRDADADVD